MVCVHTALRVQSLSRTANDTRPAIISIKYAAHCHGMRFPLFFNYWNFGTNRMIVTSKWAIKTTLKLTWFFQLFTYLSPQIFFHTLSLYFLFAMSYNSSQLRTNSNNFSSTSEDKQAAIVASKQSKCSGDVRLFTSSESSRYRPVRTRSVTSNILAWRRRRNGTETWRRRSCQREHLRLITHEKILLNGDGTELRRDGDVPVIVNISV